MQSRVIVLAHQKGGVGKSTIASNIAVELQKITKVKVIDLDMQKSLTYFNHIRAKSGLSALNIIPATTISELSQVINNNEDILLIDVGGFDSDMNRLAIAGADILISPVSDSGVELVGLLSFKEILKDLRAIAPNLQARVLLNRIHTRATNSINELKKFIDENEEFSGIMNTVLRDRVDYKRAYDKGQSVAEYNGKAKQEILELINEVKNG